MWKASLPMMLDATQGFATALTESGCATGMRLYFRPDGSGMQRITVGDWRKSGLACTEAPFPGYRAGKSAF